MSSDHLRRPSKTDNFSFAKSANKQPAQSSISIQLRGRELRGGNIIATGGGSAAATDGAHSNSQSGANARDAPAAGGSSDEEDADLASERVFTSPPGPGASRAQPFNSLKLIKPRQGFGMPQHCFACLVASGHWTRVSSYLKYHCITLLIVLMRLLITDSNQMIS